MHRLIILLSATLIFCNTLYSQLPCLGDRYNDPLFTVTELDDVYYATARPYASLFDQDLEMDIYLPANDTLSKRPVIIWAFGGAFLIGFKEQDPIPDYCRYFAERGYVTVSIEYRINFNTLDGNSAERAVYRAAQDIRAAQRFLADNASTYNIDINSMFLTGSSAGCVAGIHTAYMEEPERPASTYGITLEPSDLGCIDCVGNSNYGNQRVPVRGLINHWGAIGDTVWIENTARDNIPMISFHGTADDIVPFGTGQPFNLPIWPTLQGSQDIHTRLTNNGVENTLVAWDGIGHEPELLEDIAYLDSMIIGAQPWLYEIMQPDLPAINGAIDVCEGNSAIYTTSIEQDGFYCWDRDGGNFLSENDNSYEIFWDTPGTYEVRLNTVNCSLFVSEENTLTVTVHPQPNVNFSGLPSVITNSIPVTLSPNTPGGTFSGTGIIFNAFSPALAGPGLHTITYSYTNSGGCSSTYSQDVLVGSLSYNFVNYNLGTISPE